jgi:hypothetical protein
MTSHVDVNFANNTDLQAIFREHESAAFGFSRQTAHDRYLAKEQCVHDYKM